MISWEISEDKTFGVQTFHLSISSVSQGLSFLCVEGILSVFVGSKSWKLAVRGSRKVQELRNNFKLGCRRKGMDSKDVTCLKLGSLLPAAGLACQAPS